MSENQPYQTASSSSSPDWREAQQPEHPSTFNKGGAWVGGLVLILIGVAIMLQNLGVYTFQNWWALFILLPAGGSFSTAWNRYQSAGYLDASALRSLISGVFFTVLTLMFLFALNWSLLWPAILIAAGLSALASAFLPSEKPA